MVASLFGSGYGDSGLPRKRVGEEKFPADSFAAADKVHMADFSIPTQGMSRASADFERAASNVARASIPVQKTALPQDTVDLSTAAVNLLQAKNDYGANTKTFRIMDEMNRNVLDMIG